MEMNIVYFYAINSLYQWSRITTKQGKTHKFTFPLTISKYMAALFGMDADDSSGNPDALSYRDLSLSYADIICNSSLKTGLSVLVLGW